MVKEWNSFKRQHGVPLIHEEIKMEVGFRADVILDDKVIVELNRLKRLLKFTISKYKHI